MGSQEPPAGATVPATTPEESENENVPAKLSASKNATNSVSNTIPDDETDGRIKYEWRSFYPPEARCEIRLETIYVVTVLFASLSGILFIWLGELSRLLACVDCNDVELRKYTYFFVSGVLGGTLYGGKYLYHVVARGYWHQDRRLWRLLSPWLAGGFAFAMGMLIDAGFLGVALREDSLSIYVSLGFISGYFGDKTLRKLTEIADVIFGVHDHTQAKVKHECKSPHCKETKSEN